LRAGLSRTDRFFEKTAFFWVLFVAVAMKMAISFQSEFPQLTLLCKWDCGWYESIARQGYRSPVPPLFQNSEESNVAFFPAYPMLGRGLAHLFRISYQAALPLLSILCTFLFSGLLSRFVGRESEASQRLRFMVLLAYPATFYLFVSYSEALYLLGMFGVLVFSLEPSGDPVTSWRKRVLRGFALAAPFGFGFLLGGTRLTGFLIPAFLAFGSATYAFPRIRSDFRLFLVESRAKRTFLPVLGAAIASAGFFAYCAIRFGHWNMYFLQLKIGWYKEFSPAKALSIAFHPPEGFGFSLPTLLGNTRAVSWLIVDTMLVLLLYASVRAAMSVRRFFRERRFSEYVRCWLVWGAFAHFFIVISGDVGPWDYWGNGMRYTMPSVYLLAALWRDDWVPAVIRERRLFRWTAYAVVFTLAVVSFGIEAEYIGRFIRNEWVS
jgi:hypothetical protein